MTDWSEEPPTIELLKQMVTMRDVVEMLGFEVGNDNKIPSPWNPDERTPSCHVYEDHFWDFSHGKGGDIIDFVQAVDPAIPTKRAIGLLWRRGLRAGMEPGDVERQPVREVVDFTEEWSTLSWDVTVVRDFAERGLKNIGPMSKPIAGGQLLVPHADEDGIYGVKVRNLDGSKASWPGSQFTKRLYAPYGWDDPGYSDPVIRKCVITEGESDAWYAMELQDQAHVLSLPSGSGSWKDDWLKDLERWDEIIVIMDNDRAGKEAREKLGRKIGFTRVKDVFVPQLFNDIREARNAGWDGLQLLQVV